MSLSRRKFIQLSSLASASLMVPKFLKGFEFRPAAGEQKNGRVLVVIQLSGGNDGLNTLIPYRNDLYYKCRPAIGIQKDKLLPLNDEMGLHMALKGIRGLYDEGLVSILNGVGYPDPNRSHFRSMDIWQSASNAQDLVTSGWLGRYLDQAPAPGNQHNCLAVEVDDSLSLAMKGETRNAIAVRDVAQFRNAAANDYFKSISAHRQDHEDNLAGYLYQTLASTTSAAEYLFSQQQLAPTFQAYPDTPFGKKMKTIGALINAGTETRVYYVSHGSFDTHVNQKDHQEKLFQQMDDALTSFVADLKQNNRLNDTVIMTFSEFGRRVAQNASNGTDHGTAGNMFILGGQLKKAGVYNDLPSLEDLDNGDLKYSVDFKQVYATLLDNWLQVDSQSILGKRYEPLSFV